MHAYDYTNKTQNFVHLIKKLVIAVVTMHVGTTLKVTKNACLSTTPVVGETKIISKIWSLVKKIVLNQSVRAAFNALILFFILGL